MENNASFNPQLTNLLKEIIADMSRDVLKEDFSIIVVDRYDWCVCVLSLLAKQVNLCDSCILLLENGMEQEAFLLARSQFNNMLWIKYICDGEDNSRVKEYLYQPNVGQIKQSMNFKKVLREFGDQLDEKFHEPSWLNKINKIISENKKILKEADLSDLKIKSISELAMQNLTLFGMYVTMYNEGSKIEHSDISAVSTYRKKVLEEYSDSEIFSLDLSKSDKHTWTYVFRNSFICLFFSFESLWNRLDKREQHLFEKTNSTEAMFDKVKLNEIMFKFSICQKMLDDFEK